MKLLPLVVTFALAVSSPFAAAETKRPNIVFFLADDLGQRDLCAYGSTFYETPNLDRLAKDGARFTDAYAACPVCSPTRASLLTGQWPQRTGITDYIGAPTRPEQWTRNTKLLPASYADRLALDVPTLAKAMKAAGYATFFAGKWHLGPEGYWPENQGFDINRGGIDRGGPYAGKKYFSPYGNPRLTDGPDGEHLPDRLATETAKFIEANKDKPFFAYYSFYDVHTPLMAREDLLKKYEEKRARLGLTDKWGREGERKVRLTQEHAVYAAMVEAMDLAVGKVLAKLDELGLRENTIVIFTSDNGGLSTSEGWPTSNMPLRGGKGWMYEGGIREPLLVRWPTVVKPGSVVSTPVSSPDFFPTLLEAVGAKPQPGQTLDGTSLLPLLKGSTLPERTLFWHYPHYGNQGGAPAAAVRRGDWKLIEWAEDNRVELFNLAADLGEQINLAEKEPRRVAQLRAELHAWQKQVGAKFPIPNPNYNAAKPDGDGTVSVSGELKQWHKVTLTLDGPFAHERDTQPNPFTDYAFNVTFTHESGSPRYTVPGYFAADGDAANSSAESGTKWLAHLSPDKPGRWDWMVSFLTGPSVAVGPAGENSARPKAPFDGKTGSFTIDASDKTGRDFRAQGRLQYVGKHHLQFAGSKQYFLKAGPDAPETLLAYVDFDNTIAGKPDKVPLKTWAPHAKDWKAGDPTWKDGKGKGLIGALNYLAGKGVNAFSFLPYNAGGDGDNVWPFVERDAKLHYDCSKLDQWGIVFDHATARGLYLHFKLQENEMDDDRRGHKSAPGRVSESLDGGKLGIERRLYCRELIARFGHALALNWNIGEENTQSTEEIRDMVKFIHDTDPYRHNIVIHTFPDHQDKVYMPLLGKGSLLTGVSLQNLWSEAHQRTLKWVSESAEAARPWVVSNDEQNPASLGVPPDPGYKGHSGIAMEKNSRGSASEGFIASKPYTLHDVRKLCLWGTLMAGGAGVEYYFGYKLPENDLVSEDFRSRDKSWDYCRIALNFFCDEKIPFAEMNNANALIGNAKNDNSKYCFAKAGELYLVYLPNGGTTECDLSAAKGAFSVRWYNPRNGGGLADGSVKSVNGGGKVQLCLPPADPSEDWLAIVRKSAVN